jgi:hypothetical protein
MSAALPGTDPEKLVALTLGDRDNIVRAVWPEDMTMALRFIRCGEVQAVADGQGTPFFSRKEREAVEAELTKRGWVAKERR